MTIKSLKELKNKYVTKEAYIRLPLNTSIESLISFNLTNLFIID